MRARSSERALCFSALDTDRLNASSSRQVYISLADEQSINVEANVNHNDKGRVKDIDTRLIKNIPTASVKHAPIASMKYRQIKSVQFD